MHQTSTAPGRRNKTPASDPRKQVAGRHGRTQRASSRGEDLVGRCEMARVYREVEEGKRDSQEGSRLAYMLSQITKVLELTEIERRLTVLEGKNG